MVAIEALRGGGIDDLALQAGLSGRGFYPVRYLSFANLAVRVASGAIAGAVFGKASSWDCLAPALIVSEAGGVVRSVSGGEFAGMSAREGVVMTNSEYTDAILQAVAEAC